MKLHTSAAHVILLCTAVRTFNKLTSAFHASVLLLIMNSITGLRIHSAIASWIHSYVDNVMTKFIVDDRTDPLKTDVHLFFTMKNSQIVRSRSLPHHINYKFMCLSVY